ncbi:hypothetical protein DL96DRAFT_96411 [Flagelloscypha sp. PMI_526]|nr:hypothetical protein DL96DRAFT_96411 [Flagelloscypha sp. PMI_526]
MSLVDVTRNCFLNGYPASKWLKLCKLQSTKEFPDASEDENLASILNSAFTLCNAFGGHPDLQAYFTLLIHTMPLSRFTSLFLQATRSQELHSATNLHLLTTMVLETHYNSHLPPLGSLVSFTDSQSDLLTVIQDALSMVRVAYTLAESPSTPVIASTSELLILLLSCVSDLSQVPTSQALTAYALGAELHPLFRQNYKMTNAVEGFLMALGLVLGDDAKVEQEVQMMHQMQMGLSRSETFIPSSSADIVSFSLLLHEMVQHRTAPYGAGRIQGAAATLLALFRWNSSWTPAVFYTQLIVSSLTCLAEAPKIAAPLWRSFVCSRLPDILLCFEQMQGTDGPHGIDWRNAMQLAFSPVTRGSDLIQRCNSISEIITREAGDDEQPIIPLHQTLLRRFYRLGLVEQSFVTAVDSGATNESSPGLQREAQESGLDLDSYIEAKLSPETSHHDFAIWAKRLWYRELSSHSTFADAVQKYFERISQAHEVEALSHVCTGLIQNDFLLDLLALHLPLQELVGSALLLLDETNCETVGDPQTAFTQMGQIVMFIQVVVHRCHIRETSFPSPRGALSSSSVIRPAVSYHENELNAEGRATIQAWQKVLFDTSNEGIADSILRATTPQTLLRMLPTILTKSISKGRDSESISNGVSWFLNPLLSWLIPVILKCVSSEITRGNPSSGIYFIILRTLCNSSECPKQAILMSRFELLNALRLLRSQPAQHPMNETTTQLYERLTPILGLQGPSKAKQAPIPWHTQSHQPRLIVRHAFSTAKAGKAPSLDIDRCLILCTPIELFQILWTELCSSDTVGAGSTTNTNSSTETEIAKRMWTFVLTHPRSSNQLPLLPAFAHVYLPSMLNAVDRNSPMNMVQMTTIAGITLSALMGNLQLEIALRALPASSNTTPAAAATPGGSSRLALGEPVATLARKLASTLRSHKRTSNASAELLRQLNQSQPFIASFPAFIDTDSKPST